MTKTVDPVAAYAGGHTVEDIGRYVDRTLLADVERYAYRVFVSRADIDDLAGPDPTGIAPLLRMDINILDAQLIIAAHLRALCARPRRHIPPALIPTVTSQETLWPRTTR